MRSSISQAPWADWATRLVLEVPHYLSYSGEETAGGRQRTVRDLKAVAEDLNLEMVVLQKAVKPFEKVDRFGVKVIGVKAFAGAAGGPRLAWHVRRTLRERDALLTLAQEDSWPLLVQNAKAIHTGVWWDGPFSNAKQLINRLRTIHLIDSCVSVLSVDTNLINWVRAQGKRGVRLAAKMVYQPNYVDLEKLKVREATAQRPDPPLILYARRYELKRGSELIIAMFEELRRRGFRFRGRICVPQGEPSSRRAFQDVVASGLSDLVDVQILDMNQVLDTYRDASVSVIPTVWSEGTSYSCIESICAGVPVVSTPVGGLGNLIVPGFNGEFAAPEKLALARQVEKVLTSPDYPLYVANCLALRESFSFEKWRREVATWLMS